MHRGRRLGQERETLTQCLYSPVVAHPKGGGKQGVEEPGKMQGGREQIREKALSCHKKKDVDMCKGLLSHPELRLRRRNLGGRGSQDRGKDPEHRILAGGYPRNHISLSYPRRKGVQGRGKVESEPAQSRDLIETRAGGLRSYT